MSITSVPAGESCEHGQCVDSLSLIAGSFQPSRHVSSRRGLRHPSTLGDRVQREVTSPSICGPLPADLGSRGKTAEAFRGTLRDIITEVQTFIARSPTRTDVPIARVALHADSEDGWLAATFANSLGSRSPHRVREAAHLAGACTLAAIGYSDIDVCADAGSSSIIRL